MTFPPPLELTPNEHSHYLEDCSAVAMTSSNIREIRILDNSNLISRREYFDDEKISINQITFGTPPGKKVGIIRGRSKSCGYVNHANLGFHHYSTETLASSEEKGLHDDFKNCTKVCNFNNNVQKDNGNKIIIAVKNIEDDCPKKQKRFSEFMSIFIDKKYSNFSKIKIFVFEILPPHFIGVLISILSIYVQHLADFSCFMSPKCFCFDSFKIKTYTILKSFIDYWFLIILLGYYSLFVHKALEKSKSYKVLYFVLSIVLILAVYYHTEGDEADLATFVIYVASFIYMLFFFAICYYKSKLKVKDFLSKISPEIVVFLVLFINYVITGNFFQSLKNKLLEIYPNHGYYIFKLIFTIYVFILQSIIPSLLFSWYCLLKKLNQDNLNPIFMLSRMFLCLIMSSEISNMLEMNISEWPAILLLLNHIYFITIFYIQKNPLKWFFCKFSHKCLGIEEKIDSEEKKMVWKILSGYMLDFQMIMVPRLLILRFFRSWIGIHHLVAFFENCKLEMSKEFVMNDEMLILIIIINVLIPLGFIIWMKIKNVTIFLYKKEKMNIGLRGYLIFLYHSYFELVLMDFRFSNR